MTGREKRRLALLIAGVAAAVLVSSLMPGLLFRYQDRQSQTQTTLEEEGLSLQLTGGSGLSFGAKLDAVTQVEYQAINLQEDQMNLTGAEAQALGEDLLWGIEASLGLEPWECDEVSRYCYAYITTDGGSFLVWNIIWFGTEGQFGSAMIDDESAQVLTLYCEDGGELEALLSETETVDDFFVIEEQALLAETAMDAYLSSFSGTDGYSEGDAEVDGESYVARWEVFLEGETCPVFAKVTANYSWSINVD